MSTKLSLLTQRACRNSKEQFTSLMHIMTEDFLRECFRELSRSKASGIDGISKEKYEEKLEENLRDLIIRLKAKRYKPQPVRRAYIPKADGTKRGLGIPTVEDKMVQMGIKRILEAIFEADFMDVSYGFRPGRSCHSALDKVNMAITNKRVNYVVDMDIKKFFDTVDHAWMMRCLRQRIKDPNLLHLIGRFLSTGIMEEGRYRAVDKGTPQGGVLSPVLANIYLHYILDLWFEKIVKKQQKGYAQLVRYADDFIVCFQSGIGAKAFGEQLKLRLNKFGLEIAEEKSKIIEFGRYVWERSQREGMKVATFDFLGITHYCGKSRKGTFKLGRKTAMKKFRQKIKAMNQWLKGVRNTKELDKWWKELRQKLIGHYRYYGIGGNSLALQLFYEETKKLAHKWINRRSQRRSYNWKQFTSMLKYNPLPLPKIYYPYSVSV